MVVMFHVVVCMWFSSMQGTLRRENSLQSGKTCIDMACTVFNAAIDLKCVGTLWPQLKVPKWAATGNCEIHGIRNWAGQVHASV